MRESKLSRRDAIRGGAAFGLAAGIAAGANAKAPFREAGAPGHYTFAHGAMQLTVVSDGPLGVGPASGVFGGMPKPEMDALLTSNFLDPANTKVQQNALLVNAGDKLALIDSGLGAHTTFGPKSGRLIQNLAAAGVAPADIDAVILSHAHIDHLGGLVGGKGEIRFPNAQVYLTQADFDFWTDEKNLAGELKPFIEAARASLLPYRDRLMFMTNGQDVLPGITAMAAPGHTFGHTIFMITSEGRSLCNTADIAHHHILGPETPRLEFAYDADKTEAVATRLRVFDMLAMDRIPLLAYHFPWPGIGHVSKEGEGFRYHATGMDIVPEPPKKG